MPTIEINYLAVLVCGISAMVLGSIWYGPLFGKVWMRVNNVSPDDLEKRKEMQKSAGPLYVVQFVLTLLQAWIMAWYIGSMDSASGVHNAFGMWLAFIIPTVASACMWTNDSKKVSWTKFGMQAGYYLVLFVIFGLILGLWK